MSINHLTSGMVPPLGGIIPTSLTHGATGSPGATQGAITAKYTIEGSEATLRKGGAVHINGLHVANWYKEGNNIVMRPANRQRRDDPMLIIRGACRGGKPKKVGATGDFIFSWVGIITQGSWTRTG